MTNNILKKTLAVLWWMTCFFLTIDTGLFLYPSLSQTLLGGTCTLLTCTTIMIYGIVYKGKWPTNKGILLVMSWGVYIVFHSCFVENAEHYKMYYILTSLTLLLSLSFALHNDYISQRQIENGLLFMTVLQIACMILQLVGIKESNNPNFTCTGFGTNPNTVCILFAVLIPTMATRFSHSRHIYAWLLVLLASVIFVLSMGCRTAIIGFLTIVLIRMLHSNRIQKWIKKKPSRIYLCAFTILACIIFLSTTLYQFKKESADGRMLIWRISTDMITEKPLGWGVGMFEKNYNLCQGLFFKNSHGTEKERYLADIVRMAYNDYLEQGVETGIMGMLFIIVFYTSIIISLRKQQNKKELSVVCAFAVMSLVNFIYSAIQPWHVLIAFGAFAFHKSKHSHGIATNITMSAICITACCIMIPQYYYSTTAQLELKSIQTQYNCKPPINIVKGLEKHIDSSGEYYMFLADVYKQNQDYESAICALEKAAEYTSDTRIFFEMFNCYDKLGKTDKGICYIQTISNILPQNMTSRNILLRWYDSIGKYDEALKIANEMVETKLKVQNPTALQYQKGAQYYINNFNHK